MLLNDKLKPYRLLLASQSPRRRELMTGCGLPYELAEKFDCEETYPDDLPLIGVSEYLSTLKSEAYPVPLLENDILLTADTVVLAGGEFRMTAEGSTWHGGEILGKPRDRDDAVAMLSRLSGRTHEVVTSCCLAMDNHVESFDDMTGVTFAPWPRPVLEAYADSGDPLDKAGSYGIQDGGAFLVSAITGSWSTVVGLPLDIVLERMLKAGVLGLKSSSRKSS